MDPDTATVSWQIMTGERSILPVDCDVVYSYVRMYERNVSWLSG